MEHVAANLAEPLRFVSIGGGRWLWSFWVHFDDPERPWTADVWAHPDDAGRLKVTRVEVTSRDGEGLTSKNVHVPVTEIAKLGADMMVAPGPDLPAGSPMPQGVGFQATSTFRRGDAADPSTPRKLDDVFLARAAQAYVNAPEGRTAEAVRDIAGYRSTDVARNLIGKLRSDRYGMLTKTAPRVAGGRLTPKAKRILEREGLLEDQ